MRKLSCKIRSITFLPQTLMSGVFFCYNVLMLIPLIIIVVTLILMLLAIIRNWQIHFKKITFKLYWMFPLIGALLCVICGFISSENLADIFINSSNINPLKILIIFLSCTSLSVFLDQIGFFRYVAGIVAEKSKSSQTKLFFAFSIIIALLTIFTSNDILILTFTPFICYFAKRAKINPLPFIISEFVTANTWSMFFIIGNPTNIYIGTTFGIPFIDYAERMFLPTIIAGVTSLLIVYLLFRKKLKQPISAPAEKLTRPNGVLLAIGLIGLATAVILMAISSYTGWPLWIMPLSCSILTYLAAFIYLACKRKTFTVIKNSLKNLPYELIPFLLSMSIIVATLDQIGLISYLAEFFSDNNIFLTGFIAFLSGNLINNIPMTMLFTNILGSLPFSAPMIYAVVIASNICAFLTPVGALAGIMFMDIIEKNKINFSFRKFIFYGAIISIPTMIVSLSTLVLMS